MAKLHMSCIAFGLLRFIATSTATPNALPQPTLIARQPSPTVTFLSGSISHTSPDSTTTTTTFHSSSSSLASNELYLGAFTGLDNGIYSVTSQSGAYIIDGKTLHVGDQFLIGQEYVSDASTGLFAGGQRVLLTLTTLSASPSSSSSATMTTVESTSPASAGSAAMGTEVSTTSSSRGGAVATNVAGGRVRAAAAAVGGLMALLL